MKIYVFKHFISIKFFWICFFLVCPRSLDFLLLTRTYMLIASLIVWQIWYFLLVFINLSYLFLAPQKFSFLKCNYLSILKNLKTGHFWKQHFFTKNLIFFLFRLWFFISFFFVHVKHTLTKKKHDEIYCS